MARHEQIEAHHQRVIVDLSTKHHGIALWPPPSSDPKDPLRWPRKFKILALIAVGLFNFTGNFAGSGFSVATTVLEAQYQKTASQINNLLTVRQRPPTDLLLLQFIIFLSSTFFFLVLET